MAGNNLIIVESPAKVKTIKKYLGSKYVIDASQGHVRDLPKSRLGIDVDNDFEPDYITIRGKGELLAKLRKEAKAADKIFLATDPDREGEAISWHLINALKLDPKKKIYRISFNEISKNAVKESLKNPREIDMNLVDAQQARRALDRVVGYKISPLLWDKIKRGLSAGRVQSVALRMICDREAEIEAFIPEEYWTIDAKLKNGKKTVDAKFFGNESDKIELKTKEQVDNILKSIEKEDFITDDVKLSQRVRKAPLPFTTSTLQQYAGRMLNFTTTKTMRVAQDMYEGIHIPELGNTALITYLRTDSTRVSDAADAMAKEYVNGNFGDNYVNKTVQNGSKTNKNVQDAHEAIRPVDVNITPASIKASVSNDVYRLYNLIWKRFIASRMNNAVYDTVNAKVKAGKYYFGISGSKIAFDGYLKVYNDVEDKEENGNYVDGLKTGEALKVEEIIPSQHFTQAPLHYTEASLVKALEEQGIGRPSTYAPTIATILARRYVVKEQKNLYVTELGQAVNDIMVKEFPSIVDEKFTANMELQLDDVAEGNKNWKDILREFYPGFDKELAKAQKELENVKIADEVTDVICELCGRNMVIKYGPHGKFLACPGFPDCKNTKPYLEKIGVNCPKCGGDVIRLKTKKGRIFYGCSNNPECDYSSWTKPSNEKLD